MIKIIADEKKGNTKIEATGMMGNNVSMLLDAVESFFVECVKGLPSELQYKFIEDLGDSFDEILEKLEDIADGKEEEEEDDEEDERTIEERIKEIEKLLPKEVVEATNKFVKEMAKKMKEKKNGDK